MKNTSSNNTVSQGVGMDNLAITRLLIQLVNRYLNEDNAEKRKQIFAELTSLRNLSAILKK
jgi:hypothetical protein